MTVPFLPSFVPSMSWEGMLGDCDLSRLTHIQSTRYLEVQGTL